MKNKILAISLIGSLLLSGCGKDKDGFKLNLPKFIKDDSSLSSVGDGSGKTSSLDGLEIDPYTKKPIKPSGSGNIQQDGDKNPLNWRGIPNDPSPENPEKIIDIGRVTKLTPGIDALANADSKNGLTYVVTPPQSAKKHQEEIETARADINSEVTRNEKIQADSTENESLLQKNMELRSKMNSLNLKITENLNKHELASTDILAFSEKKDDHGTQPIPLNLIPASLRTLEYSYDGVRVSKEVAMETMAKYADSLLEENVKLQGEMSALSEEVKSNETKRLANIESTKK